MEAGGFSAPFVAQFSVVQVPLSADKLGSVPQGYVLDQNYPNPFNPTTNIKYHLQKGGHTRLVIYDILGRPVRTLVDEETHSGWHLVTWDGLNDNRASVSTGTYFYRIEHAGSVQTKKMLYVR